MSTQLSYGRDKRARQRHPRRGNVDRYLPQVIRALLSLNRPWGLIDIELVNLSTVQADVQGGGLLAEAHALQRKLRKATEMAISELNGSDREGGRLRTILLGIADGKSIRRIAEEDLGVRRETVQRSWWPQAARLVAHHLLADEKDLQ